MLIGDTEEEVEAARDWVRSLGLTVKAVDQMSRYTVIVQLTEDTTFQAGGGQYLYWDGEVLRMVSREAFELVCAPSS
jgi:hypothetical protein